MTYQRISMPKLLDHYEPSPIELELLEEIEHELGFGKIITEDNIHSYFYKRNYYKYERAEVSITTGSLIKVDYVRFGYDEENKLPPQYFAPNDPDCFKKAADVVREYIKINWSKQ